MLVGIAYGVAASSIPAPHDVRTFWLGNLCVPWVAIPFGVGGVQRSLRHAAIAGALATVCCVLAFYRSGLTTDAFRLGLAVGTPAWRVALVSVGHLLATARVWLVAGVLCGVGAGAAGWWWRRSGDRRWLLLLAGVMLVEPICWRLYEGFLPSPAVVWWVEAAVAMTMTVLVLHRVGRPGARDGRHSPPPA